MENKETSIIISAVDHTGPALNSVKNSLGQIGGEASKLQGVLGGFAVAATAAAAAAAGVMSFAGMIKGALDSAAALHDMAQKTGASVESLSALTDVAALSETSLDSVASGMQKMAKAMPDMADESKDAAKALAAIGLEGEKVSRMSTDEAMQAIAKSMSGVQDSAGKTAVAMALFGKTGADLIPFLNDLGVAGELQAKITREQAAQADNFGDNLAKLQISGSSWKREIAMGIIPALSDLSDGMLAAMNSSGGMRDEVRKLSAENTLDEWARSSVNGLLFLVDAADNMITVVKELGLSLSALINLGMTGGKLISAGWLTEAGRRDAAEAKRVYADVSAQISEDMNALLNKELLGSKIRREMEAAASARLSAPPPEIKKEVDASALSAEKTVKAKSDGYDALMDKIKQYNAQIEQETATGKVLTQGEKLAIEVKEKLSGAHLRAAESAVKELLGKEKALALQKEIEKHELAAMNRRADAIDTEQKNAQSVIDSTRSLREQTAEMGLNDQQLLELKQNRVDDQITQEEWRLSLIGGKDALGAQADAIRETIKALQDRKMAMSESTNRKAAVDTAKAATEEWKRGWEETDRIAREAFTSWATEGGSAAKKIGDTLKKALLSAIYEATIKPLVMNIYTTAAGALGISSGTSGAASALGGGSGLLSSANSAYSLYGVGSSIAGGYGALPGTTLISNASGMVGGDTLGTFITMNPQWTASAGTAAGSAAAAEGGTAAAGGMTASSAIPIIGWIIAGMTANNMFYDKGYTLENSDRLSELATFSTGTSSTQATRLFERLGVNSKFASMLTGNALENALFGFGNKNINAQGVEGAFNVDGFSGQAYAEWSQKGGLFRKDKSGTDYSAIPQETIDAWSDLTKAAEASFANLFEVMGEAPRSLDDWSFSIRRSVSNQDELNQLVKDLADSMAGTLVPEFEALKQGTETLSETAMRLQTEFVGTNRMIEMLGLSATAFGAVGIASAAARDSLVTLSGGMTALSNSVTAYYNTFYSDAEKQKLLTSDLQKSFDSLGLTMPATMSGFRDLVNGLDMTSESGRVAFVSLMGVSASFATLAQSVEAVAAAAAEAAAAAAAVAAAKVAAVQETQAKRIATYLAAQRASELAAIEDQKTATADQIASAQEIADTFANIVDSLTQYKNSLMTSDASTLSPTDQYAEAKRQFDAITAKAKLGDQEAAGQMQTVVEAFLRTSKAASQSSAAYAADFGTAMASLDGVIGTASRQSDIAQQQLQVAQAQLSALNSIASGLSSSASDSAAPLVVSDFAQAQKDWQGWFDQTAVGDVTKYDIGTDTRISADKGIFTDNAGNSFVFSASDGPYGLADQSAVWAEEMIKRYGQWKVPSYAIGTNYVPQDMLAQIHEGEAIIPKAYNPDANGNNGVVVVLKSLLSEVAALRAEQRVGDSANVAVTSKIVKVLDQITLGGDAMQTRVAA